MSPVFSCWAMIPEMLSDNAVMVRPASSLSKMNEQRVAANIQGYIRNLLERYSARGVLIGLSGGIDSAVLTALVVRALGRNVVHVCYLYERDSEKYPRQQARLVADWLGLELEVQDFEPAMREKGTYSPAVMKLTALSPLFNRYFLAKLYRWIFGEPPFLFALKGGECDGHTFKRWIYQAGLRHIEAGFNARHLYRRQVLERLAKDQNLLLLGATNRSEYLVGWFVKGGIDDLPLSPLMGLYKSQIRRLAVYLGVPTEIQKSAPTPDMIKGICDQSALGISYAKLDIILDGLDRGLADEQIMTTGVTAREISLVREMNRLSAWKRESEHATPLTDGGVPGGCRVQ